MAERNTLLRSAHDMGLAAWFGGSLMGAVGVNGAAQQEGVTDVGTARIASVGWAKWAPLGAAAIGAHLVGGTGLLVANRARVRGQKGVAGATAAKSALTGAALGATVYTRMLGKKIDLAATEKQEDQETTEEGPVGVEQAKRQLAVMQWVVPSLTAGLLVLNALQGEQQRPSQQTVGALRKTLAQLGRQNP
ncbi:hypothetical protein G3I40_37415 [Streptomyces sp. SID14478]|uniref:hypothetical protein n=1 Tax=Streptomyces sp. SID14478 TaxID=2706073 RepID=UPI0013DF114E|nr:hypothetical protein [Streptomyces sp. SID14478]NEB80850.1 hypothetical protein [Streptomyces sp. SID14478]